MLAHHAVSAWASASATKAGGTPAITSSDANACLILEPSARLVRERSCLPRLKIGAGGACDDTVRVSTLPPRTVIRPFTVVTRARIPSGTPIESICYVTLKTRRPLGCATGSVRDASSCASVQTEASRKGTLPKL